MLDHLPDGELRLLRFHRRLRRLPPWRPPADTLYWRWHPSASPYGAARAAPLQEPANSMPCRPGRRSASSRRFTIRLDVSPRPPPPCWTSAIELVDQRRHRQRRAVAPRLVEHDRQILAHPVDREAEVELARRHGLPAILHLPGLGRTLGDRRQHLVGVEAGALGEVDRLGQRLQQPAMQIWLTILVSWPGPAGPIRVTARP